VRNLADGLIYQAERFLVQAVDALPPDLRQELETKIVAVRTVLDGADVSQIRSAALDLRSTLLELNPGMRGGPATGAAGEDGPTGDPGEAAESAVGT
jgi:hypothetical protein